MLKRFLEKVKGNSYLLITFICGLFIIGIVYFLKEVSPFGDNSLLAVDFYHQYGPMLGELFDRVKAGESLIYSFNSGFGLPFFRNFANYLSSPFNSIIFLFKRENLLTAFSVIIGLKAIFSSLTMVYYLNNKFKSKSKKMIPLALLYGFCAYFTAYYWNIMWLDGLVFLPLIILGIERLIKENKYMLYISSLTLMLLSNYFIAYMICLFSVIYFIAYLFISTKTFDFKLILKKVAKFTGASLLAGGLSAFLLLPLYLGLNSISATSDLWPSSQYYSFTLLEFFGNHFSGIGSTVFASGITNAPNISVGVLPIFLLFLFIVNRKINFKTKIAYLSILLFLILAFFYVKLDFIFHAFHVPNDLPYRYSFLYSFVLIIISAYSLYNIKHLSVREVSECFGLMLALIALIYLYKYENINNSMILLNVLVVSLYFVLYLLYKFQPKTIKKLPYLMILVATLECTITINNNWDIDQKIENFYNDYDRTKLALDYVQENDDSMYRIEKNYIMTFNDPSWYGYRGQGIFSSMAYESLAILNKKLGMPGNNINSYYYKQNTPVYDLMFNIKYTIGHNNDLKRYYLYYNEENTTIYRTTFNSNLMYFVNQDIINWEYENQNPINVQNDFIIKSTNVYDVFSPIKVLNNELIYNDDKIVYKYTIDNTDDNMYFYFTKDIAFAIVDTTLYYHDEGFDRILDSLEGVDVYDFIDLNENRLITSNSSDETNIYIAYHNDYYSDFYGYKINNDSFNNFLERINENQMYITKFTEREINAFGYADDSKTIFTSIPYDRGWKVKVNDKIVDTLKIGNSLLGFNVDAGDNEIILKYIPEGSYLGLTISTLSLSILIGIYLRKKVKR